MLRRFLNPRRPRRPRSNPIKLTTCRPITTTSKHPLKLQLAPPTSPKSKHSADTESPNPAIITTDPQWEALTSEVIKTVHEYLEANQISDGEFDANIDGRPIAWILNRARGFGSNFREHRVPTHPSDEIAKMDKKTIRKTMQTYCQRIVRANVPPGIQKKADRRNFVARTARLVDRLISNGQVQSTLVKLRKSLNWHHFAIIPTTTSRKSHYPPAANGGGLEQTKIKKIRSSKRETNYPMDKRDRADPHC